MIPQSYEFSHGLCLNSFLQVWLVGNRRDNFPLFRYINRYDERSHLFWESKLIGDMKYLMRSVKISAEEIGIWTEDN